MVELVAVSVMVNDFVVAVGVVVAADLAAGKDMEPSAARRRSKNNAFSSTDSPRSMLLDSTPNIRFDAGGGWTRRRRFLLDSTPSPKDGAYQSSCRNCHIVQRYCVSPNGRRV